MALGGLTVFGAGVFKFGGGLVVGVIFFFFYKNSGFGCFCFCFCFVVE